MEEFLIKIAEGGFLSIIGFGVVFFCYKIYKLHYHSSCHNDRIDMQISDDSDDEIIQENSELWKNR